MASGATYAHVEFGSDGVNLRGRALPSQPPQEIAGLIKGLLRIHGCQ